MPIDPSIALQYKGVQFPDPVNALMKQAQLQSAMQAQQLNALRMQQAQKQAGQADIKSRMDQYTQALGRAANKQQAAEITKSMFADPVVGPHVGRVGTADQAIADIPDDPFQFGDWKLGVSGATPLQMQTLKAQREATQARQQSTQAQQQFNQMVNLAKLVDAGVLPANALTRPSTVALNQPVDTGAGAAGGVDANMPPPPVTGGELSPAERRQLKVEQAKSQIKGQQQWPMAKAAYETAMQSFGQTQSDISQLKEHPGLEYITGRVASKVTPITTLASQDAANAQAIASKLAARTFISALAELKNASKTGATGLGAVSNVEGDKVQKAYANLDQAQDTETYRKRLDELNNQLEESKKIITDAYNTEASRFEPNAVVKSAAPAAPAERKPLSQIFGGQ